MHGCMTLMKPHSHYAYIYLLYMHYTVQCHALGELVSSCTASHLSGHLEHAEVWGKDRHWQQDERQSRHGPDAMRHAAPPQRAPPLRAVPPRPWVSAWRNRM